MVSAFGSLWLGPAVEKLWAKLLSHGLSHDIMTLNLLHCHNATSSVMLLHWTFTLWLLYPQSQVVYVYANIIFFSLNCQNAAHYWGYQVNNQENIDALKLPTSLCSERDNKRQDLVVVTQKADCTTFARGSLGWGWPAHILTKLTGPKTFPWTSKIQGIYRGATGWVLKDQWILQENHQLTSICCCNEYVLFHFLAHCH